MVARLAIFSPTVPAMLAPVPKVTFSSFVQFVLATWMAEEAANG